MTANGVIRTATAITVLAVAAFAAIVSYPLLVSAETAFPDTLTGGPLPSRRQIQRTLRVGQVRAKRVRAHLEQMHAGST